VVTDATLASIATFTRLEELYVSACAAISDAGVAHLVSLPLKSLTITQAGSLTNEGLRLICQIKTLTVLDLSDCVSVSDPDHCLAGLPDLEELALSGCRMLGNDAMQSVGSLRKLWHLDLGECEVDSYLEPLAQLAELEVLTLHGNEVADEDLAFLSGLLELRELSLLGCYGVTDDGLKHLRSLCSLELLDLDECENVTADGMEDLRTTIDRRDAACRLVISSDDTPL
jgi:Leucine-rich repeat (LRR) protein